jgi:hypothetical protein
MPKLQTSEPGVAMADGGHEVDANLVRLVDALNELPGVRTFSSCGGHEGQTNAGQCRPGEFYVNFDVPYNKLGWKALEYAVKAIDIFEQSSQRHQLVVLQPWLNPALCWQLKGHGVTDVDIEALAEIFESIDMPSAAKAFSDT